MLSGRQLEEISAMLCGGLRHPCTCPHPSPSYLPLPLLPDERNVVWRAEAPEDLPPPLPLLPAPPPPA